MIIEPIIPIVWLATVFALALGLSVWRRSRPLTACVLRAAALVGLGIVALVPSEAVEGEALPARPRVVIVADRSGSMGVQRDSDSVIQRLDSSWWDRGGVNQLRDAASVRVVDHHGDAWDSSSIESFDDGGLFTPLVDTVRSILKDAPDHLVLLTDGIDTTGASLGSVSTGSTRIHTLAFDAGDIDADARVTVNSERSLIYAGQPAGLGVQIVHRGLAGRRGALVLERDGVVIERREVRFSSSGVLAERFDDVPPHDDASAVFAYTARLEPIAGETTKVNNASTTLVRVSTEPIRVLVLEGQPHWDTRFFVRAMRADGRVEVTVATTLENRFTRSDGDGRVRVERTGVPGDADVSDPPAVPSSQAELSYYDVIVLGRGVEQFFPGRSARELVAYAEEGLGSIVFLRARPISSEEPEALRALDALRPLYEGSVERRLGSGDLRRFGAGMTLFVDDPGAYRRALLSPGETDERDAYARGWSGVVRTLAINAPIPPGEDASLTVLPLSGPPGTAFEIVVRARGNAYEVPARTSVVVPTGETKGVTLTRSDGETVRATGVFDSEHEGVHRVRTESGLEGAFVVVEDRVEFLDLSPRAEALRSLAVSSGGVVFDPDDGPGAVLEILERYVGVGVVATRREAVWDRWWLWGLIVLCLCAEWALRRSAGEGA